MPEGELPVVVHTDDAPEQVIWPVLHSAGVQAAKGMSSTTPLQLSSTRLHVSVVGEPALTLHAVLVPEHTIVPERKHAPVPAEHDAPVTRQKPPQSVWPVGQPQVPLVQMPPEGELHEVPLVPLVQTLGGGTFADATQV